MRASGITGGKNWNFLLRIFLDTLVTATVVNLKQLFITKRNKEKQAKCIPLCSREGILYVAPINTGGCSPRLNLLPTLKYLQTINVIILWEEGSE